MKLDFYKTISFVIIESLYIINIKKVASNALPSIHAQIKNTHFLIVTYMSILNGLIPHHKRIKSPPQNMQKSSQKMQHTSQ
jgi:hypothetical protein